MGAISSAAYGAAAAPFRLYSDLSNKLDYQAEILQDLQNQASFRTSRIGKALKELEEGERMQRDTQNLLTRAKIELRRRLARRMLAARNASGGLFG